MEFSIGIAKFLLLFVLCVALQSRVDAENKVTVTKFETDVPNNEVVESWDHDLTNSLISSTIRIKGYCLGALTADIRVFQGQTMVNTVNQQFPKAMNDFENYNMCTSIEYPEPEDDSQSIAVGEQSAEGCDISSWFSDMDPGEYKIECDFKLDDSILTYVIMEVIIENDESE